MGWWCEVRGELTFLIAAPPWLLPSTSQQAGCSCRPGLIEVSWPPSLQRTAKCPTLHVHQQGCQCWGSKSKRVSQCSRGTRTTLTMQRLQARSSWPVVG